MTFFNAHSSTANATSVAGEGRMTVNGMTVAAARSGGVVVVRLRHAERARKWPSRVGGGLGESDIGGPVMNIVPRVGRQHLRRQRRSSTPPASWSRGNNLTDELIALNPNLTQTPGIIKAYDASGSFGGPIKKDRLWFYGSYRNLDTQTAMEGINANANAGDAVALGLGRLADQRASGAGPPDDHRPFDGAGRQEAASRFNSEYQHRCEGTPLKVETQGCHNRGDDWIGLGNNAAPFQSPEATSTAGARLLRRAVLPESGVLDDAGDQQAAPRGRLSRRSATTRFSAIRRRTASPT